MYEVEIKAIPSPQTIELLMTDVGKYIFTDTSSQLNHYFLGNLTLSLLDLISSTISVNSYNQLKAVIEDPRLKKMSVRTRYDDSRHPPEASSLILKVAMNDDTSSENGSIRKEVEVDTNLSIHALDSILSTELQVQSKWKRYRETYLYSDVTICLDQNAGYGFILEVEKLVDSEEKTAAARQRCLDVIDLLGASELENDRLEKMFAAYNSNWNLFYSTGKTFLDYPEYEYLLLQQ